MRLTKSNCLPRISASGRQCIIHRRIREKNHMRHHMNTRHSDSRKLQMFCEPKLHSASPRGETSTVSGPQNSLFPRSQSVRVKCSCSVLIYIEINDFCEHKYMDTLLTK